MPIKFHEGSKTFHIYNKTFKLHHLYHGKWPDGESVLWKAIRDKEDFSYLHEEIMRS